MGKYEPLRHFLTGQAASEVLMTFAEIERVIGDKLPEKSKHHRPWWSNNPNNNVMTKEWLAAGYKTEQVDVEGCKLVFRRTAPASAKKEVPPPVGSSRSPRSRHPLLGWLKGTVTIAPGTDLTQPADPAWGEIAWGDAEAGAEK